MAEAEHQEHEQGQEHKHDPFAADHLIGHVKDAKHFDVPKTSYTPDGKIQIPQPSFHLDTPITVKTGYASFDNMIEPIEAKLTKFMLLEVVAALLIAVVFISLARKMRKSDQPRGKLWNLLEAFLVYIRDEIARPAIGKHDADRFLPFLWTIFFFVLACNLLGMIPWLGSPTGSLSVTLALALITFVTVVGSGMSKMGPAHFWTGLVPHMDLPLPLKIPIWIGVFFIEVFGLFVKHLILAVRLLANMMAGHLVLGVIAGFVVAASFSYFSLFTVGTVSILGATALSLLELFVAFLQAYLFTFLSALFIGMAVHPH